jgi:hypothetical protein
VKWTSTRAVTSTVRSSSTIVAAVQDRSPLHSCRGWIATAHDVHGGTKSSKTARRAGCEGAISCEVETKNPLGLQIVNAGAMVLEETRRENYSVEGPTPV